MRNPPAGSLPHDVALFGLVAWLEQTRVVLPLKGVECRFAACGELLNVELDQIFHQHSSAPLDCRYTFPLPAGAAVYRCELIVNGRAIRARVEEVEEARRLAREHQAAGRRTALVEQERENLFTLSLGNVQPGDLVVVRFAYFQTLTRLADWTSFHIPFCPGVRYIPGTPLLRDNRGRGAADDTDQVPDASRISPPRMDRLHPDAAYLSVEGTVEKAGGRLRDLSSPSHALAVRDADQRFQISLADGAAAPDRDLVVRWTETPAQVTSGLGWVCEDAESTYALLRLNAPPAAPTATDAGQDIYFLVDRSGSMWGRKWEQAAVAFREFLRTLGPGDRVWATFFEDEFRDLAEQPLPASQLLLDRGVQGLERLGTGGGTELLPALGHVLTTMDEHAADRPVVLVVITDGQVGNETGILRLLQKYPRVRAHTFGIDTTVNDAFLRELAEQQRGTCQIVTPDDDIVGTVARLGNRLGMPVLTGLRLPSGWEAGGVSLPDWHAGESLCLAVKGRHGAETLEVVGRDAGGAERRLKCRLAPLAQPALRLLWSRDRIRWHLAREEREAALGLAKAANLICAGAAFVAWDEAEQVLVSGPDRELYQPAMRPSAVLGTVRYSRRRAPVGMDSTTVVTLDEEEFKPEKFPIWACAMREFSKPVPRADPKPDLTQLPREFLPLLQALQEHCRQRFVTLTELPAARHALFAAWESEVLRLPGGRRFERLLELLTNWMSRHPEEAANRFVHLRDLLVALRDAGEDGARQVQALRAALDRLVRKPRGARQQVLAELDKLAVAASARS